MTINSSSDTSFFEKIKNKILSPLKGAFKSITEPTRVRAKINRGSGARVPSRTNSNSRSSPGKRATGETISRWENEGGG